MYEHLSDPENYSEYSVSIVNISYLDENGTLRQDYDSKDIKNAGQAMLEVCFYDKAELAPFCGLSEAGLTKECSEYTVLLRIDGTSSKALFENGFYSVVEEGTDITLTASDWIYADSQFFYVSSIVYDGFEYLAKSEGMANIIEMMDKDRSLF